jgi:hypothetical protein
MIFENFYTIAVNERSDDKAGHYLAVHPKDFAKAFDHQQSHIIGKGYKESWREMWTCCKISFQPLKLPTAELFLNSSRCFAVESDKSEQRRPVGIEGRKLSKARTTTGNECSAVMEVLKPYTPYSLDSYIY